MARFAGTFDRVDVSDRDGRGHDRGLAAQANCAARSYTAVRDGTSQLQDAVDEDCALSDVRAGLGLYTPGRDADLCRLDRGLGRPLLSTRCSYGRGAVPGPTR